MRSRYSTYLSCASADRHVPKRSIIHTFVLQRNGDFIYLLLSVECFNRWWIIFNGNVLGSPRYGASAHALLITRLKMRHPTPGIGGLRTWKHYKDTPIFMERCDEKKQNIYSAMINCKVHKGSNQHIYHEERENARWETVLSIATMHLHGIPPWRKNDENTSVLFNKTLSKLSRLPCCLEAPWSLRAIVACVTLLGR